MSTTGRLVAQIQAAIAEAAVEANDCGTAVLYHDLHVADGNVSVLAARVVTLQGELDTALAALARLGEFVAKGEDMTDPTNTKGDRYVSIPPDSQTANCPPVSDPTNEELVERIRDRWGTGLIQEAFADLAELLARLEAAKAENDRLAADLFLAEKERDEARDKWRYWIAKSDGHERHVGTLREALDCFLDNPTGDMDFARFKAEKILAADEEQP